MLAQGIAKVVCYGLCYSKYSPAVPAARGCDTEPPLLQAGSLGALHVNSEGWVQVDLHHAGWGGCREMHHVHVGNFSRGRRLRESWVGGDLTVERETWAVCFSL